MATAQAFDHQSSDSHSHELLDAELALEYLNAQLQVNYVSAEKRFEAYKSREVLTEEQKRTFAWKQYSSRGKNAVAIGFQSAGIKFVCDHDAILELSLTEGSVNETPRPELTGAKIALRVSTEKRTILGKDMKVGDYESRIHLLVFDMEHAKVIDFGDSGRLSQQVVQEIDLERQILGYLRYLQGGGHHVLFFPPEFVEDDLRPSIRFSLTAKELIPLEHIRGITANMINNYLSLLWFTCAFIARSQRELKARWDDKTSLAVFRSWIVEDYQPSLHYLIRFGQPRVEILCAREVILYFTLAEVCFFSEDDTTREERDADYNGWVVAILIDVDVSDVGVAIETTSARYASRYSIYSPEPRAEHVEAHKQLVEFFVSQYIKLIGRTKLRYLFQRLREEHLFLSRPVEADGSWWMLEHSMRHGTSALDGTIRHTSMCGFDLVIAVSQTSINNQFRSRFSRTRDELVRWEAEGVVAEVKTITVALMPKSRAIVTVHVTEAFLSSKLINEKLDLVEEGFARVNIGECRLSYEVEIKSCKHDELKNPDYKGKPYSSKDSREYTLHHIYLDLESAEPAPERTSFEETETDFNDTRAERLKKEEQSRRIHLTLIHHIQQSYFQELLQHGMHILATVPVYRYSPTSPSFYKFTSMSFVTSSFDAVTMISESDQTAIHTEQILFILGMTGDTTLPSKSTFRPSPRWIAHSGAGFSHGTFAVAKSIFHRRLFALLGRINALTTLVPVSPSYNTQGDENVVRQWAFHPDFQGRECQWKPVDAEDNLNAQTYEWKYSRDWRLQEEGTLMRNREYLILCSTSNELELPDLAQLSGGSIEIVMSGQIKLRVSDDHGGSRLSTESSAIWRITISIKTTGRGSVKVEIDGADNIKQPPPKSNFRRGGIDMLDAYSVLHANLPKAEQFNDILTELKELERAWKYYYPSDSLFALCSPTFNFSGDLLFELRRARASAEDSKASNGSLTQPSTPRSSSRGPDSPFTRASSPSRPPGPNSPHVGSGGSQRSASPTPPRSPSRNGAPPRASTPPGSTRSRRSSPQRNQGAPTAPGRGPGGTGPFPPPPPGGAGDRGAPDTPTRQLPQARGAGFAGGRRQLGL